MKADEDGAMGADVWSLISSSGRSIPRAKSKMSANRCCDDCGLWC